MHAVQDTNYGGKLDLKDTPPCNIYCLALEFSCEAEIP